MTVIPLRTLRRALKSPPPLVAGAAAELFRTKVKAVELEAERLQQEAMYELVGATPRGQDASSLADAARGNIAAYRRWAERRSQACDRNPARGAAGVRRRTED